MTTPSRRLLAAIWPRLKTLLAAIFVAWLLILGLVRIFESHLLYFPNFPDRYGGDWNPRALHPQNVWLHTSDGYKLHSWWITNNDAKFTFLAFHGNAGNMADRADLYAFLQRQPANVLAVEYRGYGRSEGTPSEEGLYRDAEAGYQYLTETNGIAPQTIIAFGQSFGTAVATHLAAETKVGGVVLEAPFPSASAVARDKYWFLPGIGVVAASQLDTQHRLSRINAPILIVHCNSDPVIPPKFGEEVYQEAQPPKFILRIDTYCHEEASIIAPEEYRAALQQLLSSIDLSSVQR
jgi:fermentation-respiration switch protein FrsA (DUF1100 family)